MPKYLIQRELLGIHIAPSDEVSRRQPRGGADDDRSDCRARPDLEEVRR